jgi:hypothetical protein
MNDGAYDPPPPPPPPPADGAHHAYVQQHPYAIGPGQLAVVLPLPPRVAAPPEEIDED